MQWRMWRETRLASVEREKERQNALNIEEQRTMQLDAVKGNAELLKIVRE